MSYPTDEDAHFNPGPDLAESVPAGLVIISGQGFKVLPLTLSRLKRIWPLCERMERVADQPVEVFKLCFQFVVLAVSQTRRDKKLAKKALRDADRESVQRAFGTIMNFWGL